jgi:hypothetical protein
MRSPQKASELASFRMQWEQWTAVIEQLARRRRTRHRADDEAYRLLHRELVRTCRRLADDAAEAKRPFFDGLGELAKPWLTLDVLERTDCEILFDLLLRCRQVGDDLAGRKSSPAHWGWAGKAQLIAAVVPGLALVGWFAARSALRSPGWLKAGGEALSGAIGAPVAIAGAVGMLVAVYWVWHSGRS